MELAASWVSRSCHYCSDVSRLRPKAVCGERRGTSSSYRSSPRRSRASHVRAASDTQRHTEVAHAIETEQELPSGSTWRPVLPQNIGRRRLLAASLAIQSLGLLCPKPSHASKLGVAADNAWEALTGAPADLYFPDEFEGIWDVSSTLYKVETPLGERFLPNPAVVERAKREDLGIPLHYYVSFMRNAQGRVIFDRRYNTAKLMEAYYGTAGQDFMSAITWEPSDPNILALRAPGGLNVTLRVTRRSSENPAADRIDTSEFCEQVFEKSDGSQPRVKASQCFTKYRWRTSTNSTDIVATQVVSDYLTAYDGEQLYLEAMNRPVATYTYRMSFARHIETADPPITSLFTVADAQPPPPSSLYTLADPRVLAPSARPR